MVRCLFAPKRAHSHRNPPSSELAGRRLLRPERIAPRHEHGARVHTCALLFIMKFVQL
mgnify:CR=1 FL=1|jgi:hypothetical protein